ncbi:MAG: nucleoside-diphosphate sugar epimerase/dehydratase [Nanoarchaeota archaeon]|nr:nucleoside-diphosphate sugar epimerase/dehydratase [Nanoarchaeota archaeon]
MISFIIFQIYKIDNVTIGILDVIKIILTTLVSCVIIFLIDLIFLKLELSRTCFFSVFVSGTLLSLFNFRTRLRMIVRYRFLKKNYSTARRVLIIGAGLTGRMCINSIANNPNNHNYQILGIIDDDPQKKGLIIAGIKVFGGLSLLSQIVNDLKVDMLIIAISAGDCNDRKDLIDGCIACGCTVKIVSDYSEIVEKNKEIKLRNIDITDILFRNPVEIDDGSISELIRGRSVLVTGGGGSIGSEICRQLLRYDPLNLIIVDISENYVCELKEELKIRNTNIKINYHIASIRDVNRMMELFKIYKPEIVFHAAANKHVPLMENDPIEAIKNNILGTLNLCKCAIKYKTRSFILISTDKAVNPKSIMGVTKRICEILVSAFNSYSATKFASVRFGNVLGSNGSVVQIFKKQIEQGGPVTITHEDMVRYFMTISEASRLVLQAATFFDVGDIFILDMGKPVRIYDLAVEMIRLMGYRPHEDIKIISIGLRPGEKLCEELFIQNEIVEKTLNNGVYIVKQKRISLPEILVKIDNIERAIKMEDNKTALQIAMQLVPENNIDNEKVSLMA